MTLNKTIISLVIPDSREIFVQNIEIIDGFYKNNPLCCFKFYYLTIFEKRIYWHDIYYLLV